MGVCIYAGCEPQQDVLRDFRFSGDFINQAELMEIVNHDAADTAVDCQLYLFPELVIAVEIDLVHGEVDGPGYA
jgi:hypothetical protein